jgi:ribosome-binding factor A
MSKRRGGKRFERTDRVGELVREIVGGEIARIDDDRLYPVAVTGVDVDNELSKAVVYYDVLDPDDLPEAEQALGDHRHRMQRALGDQSHMRRTPTLVFTVDPSIGAATRIEEILEDLGMGDDNDAADDANPDLSKPDHTHGEA